MVFAVDDLGSCGSRFAVRGFGGSRFAGSRFAGFAGSRALGSSQVHRLPVIPLGSITHADHDRPLRLQGDSSAVLPGAPDLHVPAGPPAGDGLPREPPGQGGDLGHRRPDPLDPPPAGARADHPDGCPGGGPHRPRADVQRPGVGGAAGLWRQPVPAAAAHRYPGPHHDGGDHLRDDRRHSQRQPDLPGNHLRRRDPDGRDRHSAARVLPAVPGLGAVPPGGARPRPVGLEETDGRRRPETASPPSISPSVAASSSIGEARRRPRAAPTATSTRRGRATPPPRASPPNWSSG